MIYNEQAGLPSCDFHIVTVMRMRMDFSCIGMKARLLFIA
jgi:hypothetical protein